MTPSALPPHELALIAADLRDKTPHELLIEIMEWREQFAEYGKTAREAKYNLLCELQGLHKRFDQMERALIQNILQE